jgi:hypothetical protein
MINSFHVSCHIVLVAAISIQWQLYPLDIIFLQESYSQVFIFQTQELLVIQADIDKVFNTEHDPAGYGLFQAVSLAQDLFRVVHLEVIAGNGINIFIEPQMQFHDLDKIMVHVVIPVYADDELALGLADSSVQRCRQSEAGGVVE